MSGSLMIKDGGVGNAVTSGVARHVTIPVTGMTCAACQSFVQRELANQAGVKDATVSLMLHNATVTFDQGETSISISRFLTNRRSTTRRS
jgi:Cu+-exporting ATPase